ncbi:hypothetical protein [Peterkaempfera sp. SMS 1(5)a]|uniref:hypothetical protein n=1 Tax=Peterkaempfera podocarpi TaxID=3232308 RepID=UPI003672CC0D
MARLLVDGDEVVVHLSWWEGLLARRREVRVPVAAVRGVRVERDWWRALRGVGGPGSFVPQVAALGVRTHPAGYDFAAVRARRPAVLVELRSPSLSPFARLAVSMPDAEAAALRVRRSAGL